MSDAQWNLSVRLTGRGSSLARTLRDTASDARNASNEINALRRNLTLLRAEASNNISIRLDVDADHLRNDVTAALNSAGSGQGLRARLDLDADHLRDDVTAALTAAGSGQGLRARLDLDTDHLRDDVSAALNSAGAGQGLSVNLRLANAMQLRRDVENAVRWAAWGHRIEIPIGLRDPNRLRNDVTAAVRRAQNNQTIRIRVTADTSALNGLTNNLNRPGGGGGGGGAQGWLQGLLLLAPAAVPLIAGLSTSLAPLPGAFAAAGVSATAFGAALAGQIGRLSEVADAQKKYEEAVREHGRASAEAIQAQLAYQQQLAQLPPEAQQAAVALSGLKDTFSDWSDDMAGFTMGPLTDGITVLDQLIPRMSPHVESFSTQLDRLVKVAGGAVATPGFDAMADRFADFTDRQLDQMTDGVMHFLRVLSEGGAFQSGPIAAFIEYAEQNGPAAREALSAISDAVVTLLEASASAGPSLLTLVTAAARLVAALPPELVGIIIQVAAGLKLVQLAGAGAAAIAGGIAALGTRIAALQAASSAAGGGMAGLAAAFGTLGTAAKATLIASGIGILLIALSQLSEMGKEAPPDVDKLTTSLRTLGTTGKVTGEAARSFSKDLSGLADSLQKVKDPKGLDQVQQSIVSFFGTDSTPIKDAKENIDAVDKALANLVKNGQADLAADALDNMIRKLKDQGFTAEDIRGQMDDYKSALADAAFEQELAVQSMGIYGEAAAETSAKLDAQKSAADGLRASILALNDAHRSAYDAEIQFEAAVDDLTASFKENGATLDLNTEAGRANGQAMSGAAKAQDEMISAGVAAGESLASMTAKSNELRSTMMRLATDAFDGNKKKATEYVNTLLGTPGEIKTLVRLEREEAVRGLGEVQAAIRATPGAKSIVVETLNGAAIAALEAVGVKTRQLPDGRTEVFTATGQSLGDIDAVRRALEALDGKTANTYTTNHYLNITEERRIYTGQGGRGPNAASGGLLATLPMQNLATGGAVQGFPAGGYIQGPGTSTSDSILASFPSGAMARVSNSEYVIQAAAVRKYGVRALDAINGGQMALPRLASGGSVTDWRYDPQTGSLYSPSDAGSAGNKTRKVKGKEISYFDLGAVERKLKSASKATQAWNADLQKVADRVGGDVADALASMGKEGVKLADKMANGSTKYINEMAAALRNLQKVAKASLTDYTRQLGNANKLNKDFADDLAKLAAMGYGDLAAQLAEQNDTAAQQLADAASKDKGKAAKANAAAKTANNALTSEQVQDLVQIIAAIRTSKTGIHDVAATTGLGEDVIIDVANKAKSQITSSLGTRASRFISDLTKANRHMAYADGGIRAGMYATQGGIIRFAEPSTGGEAYLPLGASKRRTAMPVLADVARRFGVGLTDAQSSRVVIIREQGPLVGASHFHIGDRRSDRDLARQVEARQSYQLRRLARGGAFAASGGTR